jgi:hypothetical protein
VIVIFVPVLFVHRLYVRQCVDQGIKFAKIIYEKCSQLKKKSHNHLKSPGIGIKSIQKTSELSKLQLLGWLNH